MSEIVNIFWATGSFFQRRNLINKIVNQVSNPNVIYASEESGEEIVNIIKMSNEGIFGMDDQNKIIILNHLPEFKSAKQPGRIWTKILSECPKNCYVIFNDINKSESASLFKLVNKIGKIFEFEDSLDISRAIEFIESFFKDEKKKISPELVSEIASRVKEDKKISADFLYSNLMKLNAYIGKKKEVEKNDILISINKNYKLVIWDWFEMFDKKDFHSLMVELNYLKTKEKMADILSSTLPVIRWRFKLILLVKEYKMKSKDSREVFKEIAELKKNKDGELKQVYNEFSVRGILYGSNNNPPPVDIFTRGQLLSILKLIDSFSLQNRYGVSDCQGEFMMVMLFMFICGHKDIDIIKEIRKYVVN